MSRRKRMLPQKNREAFRMKSERFYSNAGVRKTGYISIAVPFFISPVYPPEPGRV